MSVFKKSCLITFLLFESVSAASSPCHGSIGNLHINPDGKAGGFVAKTAVVSPTAYVDSSSYVCDQARVLNYSRVLKGSVVSGSAILENTSQIHTSNIYGFARLSGSANVIKSTVCQKSVITFKVQDSNFYCQTDDPEPSHPGKAGKKSLLGMDIDNDGIRDDVEIWINLTTTNTPTRDMFNVRNALKQYAFFLQKAMAVKDKKLEARTHVLKSLDILDCLMDVTKDEREYKDLSSSIEVEFFNTMERLYADAKLSGSLAGYSKVIVSRAKYSTCNFKIR